MTRNHCKAYSCYTTTTTDTDTACGTAVNAGYLSSYSSSPSLLSLCTYIACDPARASEKCIIFTALVINIKTYVPSLCARMSQLFSQNHFEINRHFFSLQLLFFNTITLRLVSQSSVRQKCLNFSSDPIGHSQSKTSMKLDSEVFSARFNFFLSPSRMLPSYTDVVSAI